jgi:outer membrane protein OmpA-like peptidoglycan-associated protein
MKSKFTALVAMMTIGLCFAVAIKPAHAQYFSDHDGYTDSGGYRVQLEVSPYFWLPATSGAIGFARPGFANHFSGEFSSSVPPVGQIASHLHFSFMGDTVLRYGPFSGEVDLQYIDAFAGKTRFTPVGELRVHTNVSYVRVAPGFGYQLYGGDLFRIPTAVDARVGFAYFTHWEDLKGEGNLIGQVGGSGNFIQPWAGTRIAFIPAPSWRIEVAGLVQGFAVNGGGWGWGASAILSYAVTDWFALDAGYRALSTERHMGDFYVHDATGGRTLNFTAYGPVVGMSLRLGSNPPAPPAPEPAAPAAAPAPAAAKTYLVFFDWDKSDLTPKATAIIAQAAAASKAQNTTILDVSGYTDTSGTAAYNQGLSERRAQAVAGQLVTDGVPAAAIEIHAYGETHLLVPTGPGVREPQNRRVEIVLE